MPALQSIYNDSISCTTEACAFKTPCEQVPRKNVSLSLSLGPASSLQERLSVSVDIEKYLLSGSVINMTHTDCYFPIFLKESKDNLGVLTTWFLGNMFMDKYLIVNDMAQFDDEGEDKSIPFTIGLYEKPHIVPSHNDDGSRIDPVNPAPPLPKDEDEGMPGIVKVLIIALVCLAVFACFYVIYRKLFPKTVTPFVNYRDHPYYKKLDPSAPPKDFEKNRTEG